MNMHSMGCALYIRCVLSTRKYGNNYFNSIAHYNIDLKDEGTEDDRGRDEGTNFILRIKEQDKHA
jgi:hypothetical protein